MYNKVLNREKEHKNKGKHKDGKYVDIFLNNELIAAKVWYNVTLPKYCVPAVAGYSKPENKDTVTVCEYTITYIENFPE